MLSIKRDFSPSEIIGCVRSKLPVCPSYECCLKCEMKYECTFLRSKVDKNVATGSGGARHQLHANIQQLTLMSSSKCSRLFKFWKCCQKFSQFHPTSQSHLLLPANQPPAGAATWLELLNRENAVRRFQQGTFSRHYETSRSIVDSYTTWPEL